MDTEQIATLSLAAVLTGPGIPIAAFVVRQLVEYLRASLSFFANMNGLVLAFVLNAVLYAVAFAFAGVHTADGAFAAFLTWLACGMATKGIHNMLGDTLAVPKKGE